MKKASELFKIAELQLSERLTCLLNAVTNTTLFTHFVSFDSVAYLRPRWLTTSTHFGNILQFAILQNRDHVPLSAGMRQTFVFV